MIGLTPYARDLSLPARLGDPGLVLPTELELVDLVNEHLHDVSAEGASGGVGLAQRAKVVHVRYKPGVAAAATYAVGLDGGAEHAVTYKVHLGDKAVEGEVGGRYAEQLVAASAPLRPFAALPDRDASLWVFPADPKLRGAVRAYDMRRTARWIDRLGVVEPWTVRLRPSVVTLRRYKHSRRAVFHVLAKLRGDNGARDVREFGLRVLPMVEAGRSVERRLALASLDLPVPRCVGHDPVAGWILEEWLPGKAAERTDLSVAPHALRCAAQLHQAPVASHLAPGTQRRRAPMELLQGIAGVETLPPHLGQPLDVPATSWIHGDLHPDQVLIQGSGASLLDMDALRLGAIEEDLASWAADMLAFDDSASLDAAVVLANLQDLYRTVGGPSVDKARLRALTIIELFERAAAAVRRLEEGAFVHASRLVAVARSITGQGS
ncbi:MAG: hypothetical protein ACJA0P_001210 [Planctomycetota bacterium]|jgi:hypothetical protein